VQLDEADHVFISLTGRMPDKSNGDIAADGYHKYKVKYWLNLSCLLPSNPKQFSTLEPSLDYRHVEHDLFELFFNCEGIFFG
jgi:hypothetical protein